MRCVDFKEIIKQKSSNSFEMPDDENLLRLTMESFHYIACKCEPQSLVKSVRNGERVIRDIRGGKFIAMPDEPDFNNQDEHIILDESLTYALINYVCFLISKDEAVYKKLADELINEYNANDGKEGEDEPELLY